MAQIARIVWLLLLVVPAFGQGRAELLVKMEAAMGPMPRLDRARPLGVATLATEDAGTYTRSKITYEPEAGRKVFAWLLVPKGGGRRPAALALHQTTRIGKDEPAGLGGKANLHYAKELAERGWVVLAPDYPSFGDDGTDFAKECMGVGMRAGRCMGL
jgi:hypothetical protein